MKIPSANLNAFYILSQERNFSKAAKVIGLSQPAFSQRIKALEAYFESTLIIREKNNIQLTDIGQRLLRYTEVQKRIEDEFLETILSSADENELSGQIRIAGFSSINRSILIPTISPILNENPKLSIQIFTSELRELPSLLFSSKADFILHNKEIKKEGIRNIFLGFEENVLVEAKNAINKDIFLDHDETDPTTSSYFKLLGKDSPKHKRYLDDVYGLLDGVKLGLGSAILPKHLVEKEFMKIKNKKISLRVPVFLSFQEAPYYTTLQKEVIKIIKNSFKRKLSI